MKKLIIVLTFGMLLSCNENPDVRGIPGPAEVEAVTNAPEITQEEMAENLKKEGFETFTMKDKDTSYLMQKYFVVLLKAGKNREQDSATAARLQEEHMAHLSRMATAGYASLIGPMGDDGELRGMVIYNVPTRQIADSLAQLDPMVKAGRLEVETHSWWASKGSSLK
jgi:uncharacterized protein